MLGPARTPSLVRQAAGFTLVEALLAMALLAACLVPAAYALRDAVRAPGDNAMAAHNLDCVGNQMETMLAMPYSSLYTLANGSGYTPPADPNCPLLQVKLQLYGNDITKNVGPGGTSRYLVYVSVALLKPDGGNPYTLTTLVSR
jgi:type II secretory pathway pseudopilin PulG